MNGEPLARANQGSSRTGTRRAGQCHCANVIEKAFQHLLQRHRFSRPDIRFWVVHPGGRKAMDDVQRHRVSRTAKFDFHGLCCGTMETRRLRPLCSFWTKWCAMATLVPVTGGSWLHWVRAWRPK